MEWLAVSALAVVTGLLIFAVNRYERRRAADLARVRRHALESAEHLADILGISADESVTRALMELKRKR